MTVPLGRIPLGSADVLPRLAAEAWPERMALRAGDRSVTFAELDREISRLAYGLRQLIGGDGLPVVVSAALGLSFPTVFYAVLRSGNVVMPVNPRMPAETFAGVLEETGARAAVLGRVMYERVRRVLGGLELVLSQDVAADAAQLTCAEVGSRGDLLVEPRDRSELTAAVGGRTHGEVKAEAVALAAGLGTESVVLDATSSYRPARLGAGLVGGATQVLFGSPSPAAAVREATRCGATHVWRDSVLEAVAS